MAVSNPAPAHKLITSLAELDALDPDSKVDGYCGYERDAPPPGPNNSAAYAHGYRCAYWDAHPDQIPPEHRELTQLIVERRKL